jgi:rubrerythrin
MQVGATRRDLVKTGIGVAAAGSLAMRAASAVAATTVSAAEVQALSYALQTERLAVIIYRQVLASDVASSRVASELRVLLGQDLQHLAKLEQVLKQMGAVIPQGPTGVAAAQAMLLQHGIHRSLTALHSQHDGLRVLIDAESLTEGAYFKAIPELEDQALVRLSVEILGSDAQHWAVLSSIQHDGDPTMAVPYPFVQGSS